MTKKTLFLGLLFATVTFWFTVVKVLNRPLKKLLDPSRFHGDSRKENFDQRNFKIYVRLTSRPKFTEQLENWLFKSMELFFPKHLASTIVVFDSEKKADREYAAEVVRKYDRFDLNVCYMEPVPETIIHKWGKERMYLDMMHADFCNLTGYVGFVDVDTLFVTAVTQDIMFEDGKPIVAGRIGIPRMPCWIDTAEYILGLKQVMQCMSYFPVVFKVDHIVEMRRYVEKLHGKPFKEVFRIAPAAVKVDSTCFCHYSIMCNYMWYFYRNSYAWHLQLVPLGKWDGTGAIPSMVNATYFEKEVLASEKVPIPRSSIHVRHFMLNGKYQDAIMAPVWYTNKVLKEGFCYSFGHDICPEHCKEFSSTKLQDSLFAFENYRWQWDPRCLETQFKHYEVVKDFRLREPNGFITDVKNKTNVCMILKTLS